MCYKKIFYRTSIMLFCRHIKENTRYVGYSLTVGKTGFSFCFGRKTSFLYEKYE
jgi:hypothetical protein